MEARADGDRVQRWGNRGHVLMVTGTKGGVCKHIVLMVRDGGVGGDWTHVLMVRGAGAGTEGPGIMAAWIGWHQEPGT
jgi:hypothetical protein